MTDGKKKYEKPELKKLSEEEGEKLLEESEADEVPLSPFDTRECVRRK